MTIDELNKTIADLKTSLDAMRLFFESVKMDFGAVRTSEPFRVSNEGVSTLVVTTASVATDVLPAGLYHICSDTSGVFIAIGSAPTAITDGHDYRLVGDGVFGPVEIFRGERVAAIIAAGTANLYIHRIR